MTRVTDAVRSVKPEAIVEDKTSGGSRIINVDYAGCWLHVHYRADEPDAPAFLTRAIVALNALQDEVEGR